MRVLLDDAGGNITVTLTVNEGVADLRGFFLDISDFSLFSGLEVTGADVTGFKLSDNKVINLGHGINLHGGGSPCPCDLGVAIGTPGIGKDDIFQTTFVLDADLDLVLDNFAGELLGVRVTSVGIDSPSSGGKDSKRFDWNKGDDTWHAKWDHFKGDIKGGKDDDPKKDGREGSAKLIGRISDPIIPVPEPNPALLTAFGLVALGYAGHRMRRRSGPRA